MGEPIKHTRGPFWESAHCLVGDDGSVMCEKIREREDYRLLVSADHAPHICANPKCPGDINRRKLELWKQMAAQIREDCRNCDCGVGSWGCSRCNLLKRIDVI